MLQPCDPSQAHIHSPHEQDDAAAIQNKDHITELPDELLSIVASELDLRDAVKTTALSKRWTHILPSLDKFIFNRSTMFPNRELYGEDKYHCAEPWTDKFVRGVTRFLDFYQPPRIRYFEFGYCLTSEQADFIDGWVALALRKGAQHLALFFHCPTYCRLDHSHAIDEEGTYVFRSALFNGAETNLQKLMLVRCRIELGPDFSNQYYCQLRILFMEYVTFGEHDLQTLLSSLVMLEHFILEECKVPEKLSFTSSTLLRILDFDNLSGLKSIEMPNSNLNSFRCITKGVVAFNSKGLLQDLEYLYYSVHETGSHNVLASLPDFLPKLKYVKISIRGELEWVEQLSRNITMFATVTELVLVFLEYTKFCFSVLKAFPSLQHLNMKPKCGYVGIHEIRKSCPYENKYLRKVTMSCCGPLRYAQLYISFLEHATTVEQLIIEQGCEHCKLKLWDEGEQDMLLSLLQDIPKNVSVVLR